MTIEIDLSDHVIVIIFNYILLYFAHSTVPLSAYQNSYLRICILVDKRIDCKYFC